jgi:hypothetical protein
MKVFVFSETAWALGRVYTDVARNLPDMEFRYSHWGAYSWDEFKANADWCDICVTNLLTLHLFKNDFPWLIKRTLFISHGESEHFVQFDPSLNYAMTSDSVRVLFPPEANVHLTPNGVDGSRFHRRTHSGSIHTMGWCGAPRLSVKRIDMAQDIAKALGMELQVAANPAYTDPASWMPMTYAQVEEWYQSIDVVLITSGVGPSTETGPLAAFEAVMSGCLVIGTSVGNFRHVPGPKFESVEEAVRILEHLKQHPEEVRAIANEQYEFVRSTFDYRVTCNLWRKAFEATRQKRVLVYNKLDWSVARVYRDVEKALKDVYRFEYYDWTNTQDDLYAKIRAADVVLSSLPGYGFLQSGDLSKTLFVCHGYPEFKDFPQMPATLRYGMTSDVIRPLFKDGARVMLTPNGVDPSFFTRLPHAGALRRAGWVGSEDPSSGGHKRSGWAREICERSGMEYVYADRVPYEGMNDWYHSVDVLLITAGPEVWRETGPLPAYEAIVAGIPVIGTRVGNFASIPGPKFETIDEALAIVSDLRAHPEHIQPICDEQYAYVMARHTYPVLADAWRAALEFS